jgi:ABC-type transport system substrate-binding protein
MLLAMGLAGCTQTAPEPDTLVVGIHAKRPAALAPFAGSGWLPEALAELYYDGGFNLEPQGDGFEPVPRLFEKEYARWGSTYYVRLARGIVFSEAPGFEARELTAEDVVFTFSTLRRRVLGGRPFASTLLRSVRLSDRRGWDVAFVFAEDPGKEAFIRLATTKIVPRPPSGVRVSAWVERLERWPVGTGPYRVSELGETLLLEARDTGEGAPRHPRIRIRFSEIPGSLEQDFLAGRIAAYAGAWPPDLFEIPPEKRTLRYHGAPAAAHYALALNTTSGPLVSLDARRDLLRLVEPEALIRTVVPDPGASVSYSPWPQAFLGEQLGMRPGSLEALVPSVRGTGALKADLELLWHEQPEDKRLLGLIARRLAEQLERGSRGRVRIARMHGLDAGSLRLRLAERRFDLCLVRLEQPEVPEMLRSGAPEQNYTGWRDAGLDGLLLRWPRAEDMDERRAIVRAVTRRLGAAAAWCFLFTPVYRVYYDSELCRLPAGGVAEMMRAVETW